MKYLSEKFLSKYKDFADHQSEISKFVFLRTYSRYLTQEQRREVWRETPARVVDFSLNLERTHRLKNNLPIDHERMVREAEEVYDNIYNLRQFPSGRTMWVGGAVGGVGEKYSLSNFNCSFSNIECWEDLAEAFYLLLVGTGFGFKATPQLVSKLPPLRKNVTLSHDKYETVYPYIRVDETELYVSNDVATIHVGDSKEGK